MIREYFFANNNPAIVKEINTEQFQLSEQLLDLRYAHGLTFEEAAKLLGIPEDIYISYEYGDSAISIMEYVSVIDKLVSLL